MPNPSDVPAVDSSVRSALDRAVHHARAYLATLDTGAVAATVSRQELLSRLDVPLTREGVAADVVVDELASAVDGGLLRSASGRFFAWVIGGALPSAVATEWLMSAWDQNAAIYAADLNLGVFDPFITLTPLAHRHKAWVHVDGAFGLFALASSRFDSLTAGMDLVDSWATDCHKWLNVPQDCGFAAVRHRDAHLRGLTIRDLYFVVEDAARDEIDWNPEWSRRARGFPVYAALRELGRDGLTSLVDRSVEYCVRLVDSIGSLPSAEIVWRPTLNQGLVRFLAQRPGAAPEDHDARTDEIIGRIKRSGEAMFGGVTWNGRRAMRVSVVNWRTTSADVDRTIAAVARAICDDGREAV
ncbi:MAG: hypothetical protein HY646_10370 [Acidobacteria bacterium]|nr:hypothetical protein [Acidobacteriota bacterium]